ncbi:conjugal transfer protein TraD [Aurantimonas sp. C2-3-R2]
MTSPNERRRHDTRLKIELGGLIVKVGMKAEDKAFLLGVLADAAELRSDGDYRARMIDRGRREFERGGSIVTDVNVASISSDSV